ncbi:hypothetical protein D9M68_958680 [compost metagenome]
MVGTPGTTGDSFSVATPSMVSVPWLTRPSITDDGVVSSICTSPVRAAMVVAASPLYGTCSTFRPAMAAKRAEARWP